MAINRSGDYGFLDRVRLGEGNEKCKAVFGEICESDKRRAALMLNDRRLTFPCLFILLPQIETYEMDRYLSPRITMARRIVGLMGKRSVSGPEGDDLSEKKDAAYSALRWMLETGHADDGLGDDYEEILDITASVLISLYKDQQSLPAVFDLLFNRNRKGHNIHTLVWAVFQIHSVDTLKLIAQRIRSSEEMDARLAFKLLGIEAVSGGDADSDNQKRYDAYLQWLKENDPFLYFTGESLQLTSQPAFCRVDLERKYIHRGTPSYDRQPVVPADDLESRSLAAFNTLGQDEKTLLSEYSHRTHKENLAEWKRWLQRPIDEQIKTAKREGFHDYDHGHFV